MFKIALSKSKELLKGKRLTFWGVILIYLSVMFGVSFTRDVVLMNVATFLVGMPAALGFMKYCINLYHKKEKLEDLIYYFENYSKNFKLILATLWYTLIVTIGMILFVVPGIIWAYRYVLVFYILITDERVSIKKSFEMSKEKMHGHKFKYFAASFVLGIAPMILIIVGTVLFSVGTYHGVTENPNIVDDITNVLESNLPSEVEGISGVDITYDFTGLEETKEDIYQELNQIVEESADANMVQINHATNLGNSGAIVLGLLFLVGGWIWFILIIPRLTMVETVYAMELLAKDKKEEEK